MDEFKIVTATDSGPGGQHKNRVQTAVTITHIPTGLQEKCEETRSQHRNKNLAMERLMKRIEEQKAKEKAKETNDNRKKQIQNTSTTRTYNYPRNQVIDHRTGKKANLEKVMKGNLDLLK